MPRKGYRGRRSSITPTSETSDKIRRGKDHPNWKGGRRLTKEGYVTVLTPDHPRTGKDGYVLEHRLIMERELGRYLEPQEIVHHKNGIKDDNRIENLALYAKKGGHLGDHNKGYRHGYRDGYQDGMDIKLAEVLAKIEELRKENRLLRWFLSRQSVSSEH